MAGSTDAQAAEQLKHKVAEIKMMRTRVDCAKAEAEAAKQQAKDAKALLGMMKRSMVKSPSSNSQGRNS